LKLRKVFNNQNTDLGSWDWEEEIFSEPSMVPEHTTLFEILWVDQIPDPITPIEGLIFPLRLGTEGLKNPDAFAIKKKLSYQKMKIFIFEEWKNKEARILYC